MNYYLPTREECRALVETTEAFYVAERVVEGQNVEMYDYRLASISDFFPEDGSNWTELRGLTFVQLDDGTWERNILMQKFFNYSQTLGWMPEDLDNKEVSRVQNKEDGSIISAVKFPNGVVRMKSKMSFESDQAVSSQILYDNGEKLQEFISICFRNNFTPIFEYCGMNNQIVLEYDEDELILLQVRDENGNYLTKQDMDNLTKSTGIKVAKDYDIKSIEELAENLTKEEVVNILGDKKFQSLTEMIEYLSY